MALYVIAITIPGARRHDSTMAEQPGGTDRLAVIIADITTLDVDAIVNAANSRLAGGGGVDGAIHRAAGPALLAACQAIGGCPTGAARITPGFRLPARQVIHAVGPRWRGGDRGEPALLASAYRQSLSLAADHRLSSIAFSAISTGIYGFPPAHAAEIAVTTVRGWLEAHPEHPMSAIFCCFSQESARHHETALALARSAREG